MNGTDRRLVDRMLAGDERAFDAFFDTHYPGLYRFALSRLGHDEAAAEDVAQAAVCRGIRKIETWRGEASLFTWLCTICRRELATYLKKHGRESATERIEDRPDVRAALESLGASFETPASAWERQEWTRLVWVALDRLPTHYGQALEWKYLEGVSVNEIARRLETSGKAAESLLTRARSAFRDAFATLTDATEIRS